MPLYRCQSAPPIGQPPYCFILRVPKDPDFIDERFYFDTREELEEVVAFAQTVKERGRKRKENERPFTYGDLPSLKQFMDEIVKSLHPCPPKLVPSRGDQLHDCHVMIERCDAQCL